MNTVRKREHVSTPLRGRDFRSVENRADAIEIICSIAMEAGKSAASEAKALHLSRVYALQGRVIRETADGVKEVIETAKDLSRKRYFSKYTAGIIMHASGK